MFGLWPRIWKEDMKSIDRTIFDEVEDEVTVVVDHLHVRYL